MTGSRRWVMVLVAVMALAACSSTKPIAKGPPVSNADAGPAVRLVTLGSSETTGDRIRDPLQAAWPQLVFHTSLPERAVFVNLGVDRSTVAEGLADQLPEARTLRPTLAIVWFGSSDAFAHTPVDRYASRLGALVSGLRATGARVLLVAGPGPADGDVDLAAYDAATRRLAAQGGATIVDLEHAGIDPRVATAQQLIATAVAKAIGPVR